MVQLGEWSVVVDLPRDATSESAVAVAVAVTEALRTWAVDAENEVHRGLGINLRKSAVDPQGR